MVYATFTYDERSRKVKMELTGHAASAPRGEDLVCAGVSALALTAGKAAQLMYSRGLLRRRPLVRLDNGDAVVIATARTGCEAEMLMAFWTVEAGIHALAQKFPQYVKLEKVLRV